MALRKSRTLPTGMEAPDAYHRVERVEIDYARQAIHVHVGMYATEAARRAGRTPLNAGMDFTLSDAPAVLDEDGNETAPARTDWTDFLAARNPQAAAYTYIKTRPEFSGATDVLED